MISYYYGLFFKDTRIMLCLTIEGTLNSRKCGYLSGLTNYSLALLYNYKRKEERSRETWHMQF